MGFNYPDSFLMICQRGAEQGVAQFSSAWRGAAMSSKAM